MHAQFVTAKCSLFLGDACSFYGSLTSSWPPNLPSLPSTSSTSCVRHHHIRSLTQVYELQASGRSFSSGQQGILCKALWHDSTALCNPSSSPYFLLHAKREFKRGNVVSKLSEGDSALATSNEALAAQSSATGASNETEESAPRRPTASLRKAGDDIVDILRVFLGLLQNPVGSVDVYAAAGRIALERVKADAEALCEREDGEEGETKLQVVFELLRTTKLLALDVDLIRSARKQETLMGRLKQAEVHCKQAISLAEAL
eukprot:TRINITY_DN10439_c0_g1_i1.p1 TRINITY_DN10439_c0_g1~~TRINITY_DN10439_c0_g1_i1.p1  ORF type:complete len:259 (-),score=23.36 TRINITY_DN10439_c0_g1_i1:542-1318(-)